MRCIAAFTAWLRLQQWSLSFTLTMDDVYSRVYSLVMLTEIVGVIDSYNG